VVHHPCVERGGFKGKGDARLNLTLSEPASRKKKNDRERSLTQVRGGKVLEADEGAVV